MGEWVDGWMGKWVGDKNRLIHTIESTPLPAIDLIPAAQRSVQLGPVLVRYLEHGAGRR